MLQDKTLKIYIWNKTPKLINVVYANSEDFSKLVEKKVVASKPLELKNIYLKEKTYYETMEDRISKLNSYI